MKIAIKKLIYGFGVLMAIALITVSQSWATSLAFIPQSSSWNINDSFNVDIQISDLGGSLVGAFELNVNYDSSILTFDSYSLGSGLGVNISIDFLDPLADAYDGSMGDDGFGTIHLYESSWLALFDPTELANLQSDSFILATLSFTGSGVGNSGLSFHNALISDDWGDSIDTMLGTGSVEIVAGAPSPVPEPATLLLFSSGLASLTGMSLRKRKNKCS